MFFRIKYDFFRIKYDFIRFYTILYDFSSTARASVGRAFLPR